MKITIHQPEHLIWLGLIDKISKADLFVILDSVQFSKNYFHNRNKIRTDSGWTWVTVPVKKHKLNTPICDVKISDTQPMWKDRIISQLQSSYSKAPFFKDIYDSLKAIYSSENENLSKLNIELIKYILEKFGIRKDIELSSNIKGIGDKKNSDLILSICKHFGADSYLSGPFGRDYLIKEDFKKENINIEFHEFEHPVYKQIHGEFIPGMSSVDYLFNEGPKSIYEIKRG